MFETEIAAGMVWLDAQDAKEPHSDPWFSPNRIGADKLNLMFATTCVIGQSQPGGHDFDSLTEEYGTPWMVDHGFTLAYQSSETSWTDRRSHWSALTDEWRQVIISRRQSAIGS